MRCQPACKPGSVPARKANLHPRWMTIHLERMLPCASRDQPGRRTGKPVLEPKRAPCRPYSVLLPVGFAVPPPLPEARCALTAPFHPCRGTCRGGLFSVALSLGSPPPGVTRHRVSMEPGLSSRKSTPFSGIPFPAVIRPTGTTPISALRRNGSSFEAHPPVADGHDRPHLVQGLRCHRLDIAAHHHDVGEPAFFQRALPVLAEFGKGAVAGIGGD